MKKKKIRIIFPFICFIIIPFSFILYQIAITFEEENYEIIIENCIYLCIKASYERNISQNLILSNIYKKEWKYKEWVCYISEKNLNNQYLKKNFKKFVELDTSCKPIRIFDGKREILIGK